VRSWPFVDRSRVAVFGWSYGGYMALRALSSPERNLLAAGIAVAPVSDWRYYDASALPLFRAVGTHLLMGGRRGECM